MSYSAPGTPPRYPTPSTLRQASSPLVHSTTAPTTPTTANQIRSFSDAALAVTAASKQAKRSSLHGAGIPAPSGVPGTPPPGALGLSGVNGGTGAGNPNKTRARDLLRKHYGLGVGPPPSMQGKVADPMDLGMSYLLTSSFMPSILHPLKRPITSYHSCITREYRYPRMLLLYGETISVCQHCAALSEQNNRVLKIPLGFIFPLDSTAFDAKAYYEQLITTSSLPVLLRRENELLTGMSLWFSPPSCHSR